MVRLPPSASANTPLSQLATATVTPYAEKSKLVSCTEKPCPCNQGLSQPLSHRPS